MEKLRVHSVTCQRHINQPPFPMNIEKKKFRLLKIPRHHEMNVEPLADRKVSLKSDTQSHFPRLHYKQH